MPFLIEVCTVKGRRWVPAIVELNEAAVNLAIAGAMADGVPAEDIRTTEMDEARIEWRFAQAIADRKFRKYMKAHRRAYNLKIKIRSRHWPEGL